ncbi:hypothetical protein G7Y79_00010g028520 [Physcia stellaris]|nr:hypothetical protein G7Y79_00010g028520 [Physcia stellaris]
MPVLDRSPSNSGASSRRHVSPRQPIDWNRALQEEKIVYADDENQSDLRRSHSPQPPVDWEQVILDADAHVTAMGELMLSDASCKRNLKEAANHYGRAHFCSIIQQILRAGIQNFEDSAPPEELKGNAVYQCFRLNNDALSEWLFARLGSARDIPRSKVDLAWATSSKEYLEKFWPETGVKTLKAIERVMKSNGRNFVFQDTRGIHKVVLSGDEALTEVHVRGSKSEIVQTAQQLAWMMSAFQTQRINDQPRRIYSQFRIKDLGDHKFILEQSPLNEAPDSLAPCWLPMLHGSVIAQGFPTPPIGIEKGAEMSLAAIKILAGVEYPVYLEGVTFLRGWSTLLYPVRASKDFSLVQWHMVESDEPDDERLKPNKQSVNVSNWKDVGLDSLRRLRSFVGYCSNANIHVGTESFDVQVPEEKSGASSAKSRWLWGNKITISIASSGIGAAGPEVGGEMGLHKKARASITESTDPSRVLVRSADTPVVLYDVPAGTGWLVPEINAALHIARSWLLERGDLAKAEKSQIPLPPITEDGGRAAQRTIRNNRGHRLKYGDEDLSWSFYDTVNDSVRLLRACRETQVREESSESGPANHPDILVLFCNNIQAPIQPVDPDTICRKWNPMPGGENYLVASVRSLKAVPMKNKGKATDGESFQVGSARAKTAKRKSQKAKEDEDENSSQEEASNKFIRPNTSRTKKSQQQRKDAVSEDEEDLSSQNPSDAEQLEENSSASNTDESATSEAETLEQDDSDTESTTVRTGLEDEPSTAEPDNMSKENNPTEDNPAVRRLVDEKFREEEDALLKAMVHLERNAKEGLQLYHEYAGKVEQKQAVKALFDEMAGVVESTREKFDS